MTPDRDLLDSPGLPAAGADAKPHGARVALLVLAAAQIVVMFGFVLIRREPPHYDEPWYLGTVHLLHERGLSRQFLLDLPGPAGPLYTFVHALFEPATHLRVPLVRVVNPLILLLIMLLGYAGLRLRKSRDPLTGALAVLGVPMTWVISGMALTELPAMLFVAVAVLMLLLVEQPNRSTPQRLLFAALGGLSLGIAVLGRQPFLVVLGGLPFLLRDVRRDLPPLVVFAGFTIAVTAPVFWVWRGLVPPNLAEVGRGIAWFHGMWSLCYGTVIVVLLAPAFLRLRLVEWVIIITTSVALSFALPTGHVPMQTVAMRFLPASLLPLVERGVIIAGVGTAITFVVACVRRVLEHHQDRVFITLIIATGLLLLTPMKITHVFSTRYVAMTLPLIVLAVDRFARPNYWKVLRLSIGSVLGFLSLWSYFSLARSAATGG